MTDSTRPEVGRSVAHYAIEEILGRGSVGTVYLAKDQRIGRPVALKWIEVDSLRFEDQQESDEFFRRLQREVEVCGRLNHPNLVTLYDVAYENDRVSYLAMELIDGPSLLDLIKERKPEPLPLGRVLGIVSDVLRGLAFAHSRGIVHRDIKPANILLTREGVAKIADFGIARPTESSMTAVGTLMGTPNYMSPEQVRGQPTSPQSDLFSLGAVLYEMVTARKPFAATDLSGVLYKVVGQPHPPIEASSIPVRLRELIDRLLEKQPEARPASAEAVLSALGDIEAGLDTQTEDTAVATGLPGDTTDSSVAIAPEESPELPSEASISVLSRVVPGTVLWLVLGIVSTGVVAVSTSIALQIDSSPTVVIPEESLQEFRAKREALEQAGQMCADGKLDECIAAYDAYLDTYPYARAASMARDEAAQLRSELQASDDPKHSESAWKRFKSKVKRVFGSD